MKSQCVEDTFNKINARPLTLLIFAGVMAMCGRPLCGLSQRRNCCRLLRSVFLADQNSILAMSENILVKLFALLHTSHSQPFNEMFFFSSTTNHIVATALLLTSSLHCCQQRIFDKQTILNKYNQHSLRNIG